MFSNREVKSTVFNEEADQVGINKNHAHSLFNRILTWKLIYWRKSNFINKD